MINQIDETIKHAVMANHDGELKGIAIVMVVGNNEPEIHLGVRTDVAHVLNSGVDILKVEMLKLLNQRFEERKPRE